mgnify:CR=1 FL=1
MQSPSIYKSIILIVLLINTKTFTLETPKPPQFILNNQVIYSHNIDLIYDEIFSGTNTFFCIAQAATNYISTKCNSSQEPTISGNYFLHAYNNNGMDMISNTIRFEPRSQQGWQYYIFKTKNKKGLFTISLLPTIKNLPDKNINVRIK